MDVGGTMSGHDNRLVYYNTHRNGLTAGVKWPDTGANPDPTSLLCSNSRNCIHKVEQPPGCWNIQLVEKSIIMQI